VLALLFVACHRTEYVEVPRGDGGTVRIVKARVPWSKKLDVAFGRYFLIRRNAEFAAIRLGKRPGDAAGWDCSYQGDGSGRLLLGARQHGEVSQRLDATKHPGVYSTAKWQLDILCGPLAIGWSPGNWLYPRGLWSGEDEVKHEHDPGVDVAVTTSEDLASIDVFDPDLDWLTGF